jgi:hypothetical protein
MLQGLEIQKLEVSISRERLNRYLLSTKLDLEKALKLYELNLRVSQLLYGALHGFEVALRNSMHDQLTAYFKRADWYEIVPLHHVGMDMVSKAKAEAMPEAHIPGKVIAELTLGFWAGLTASGYLFTLWNPCLYKAFPNVSPDRKKIHAALSDLKTLRNRISHHERILGPKGMLYGSKHPFKTGQDLLIEPSLVLDVLSWICKDTTEWTRRVSSFDFCLKMLADEPAKSLTI